ncbi:MAG: hypothetical protein DMG84_19360 [Acidobacteria bacterium]|nr:MAG: hypothetical protein DMG84_19360 [Acidobacteriota bacterium]
MVRPCLSAEFFRSLLGQLRNVELCRVARGVMDGALERFLVDSVANVQQHSGPRLQVNMNTSGMFDLAEAQHVPALVLPAARNRLSSAIPEDTLAKVDQETAKGFLLVGPEHTVSIAGAQRYAWWRIDPKSGETTAVTDDGLYGSEMMAVLKKNVEGQVLEVKVFFVGMFGDVFLNLSNIPQLQAQNVNAPGGLAALCQFLKNAGIDLVQRNLQDF